MPVVRDVLAAIEKIAPSRFAFDFDHVGLQVGDPKGEVSMATVSLDRSYAAATFAADNGCQLLVCHHPLIWEPLEAVTVTSHVGRTLSLLLSKGIGFIAAHTNWDCAAGGINDVLAGLLGLKGTKAFGSAARIEQLKMIVFTPKDSVDKVIDAAAAEGAGNIGLYSRCAFYQGGTGTFFGNEGTNPKVGSQKKIEEAEEIRIEMVLPSSVCGAVEKAVCAAHPYETPAIEFFHLNSIPAMQICRIGKLPHPLSFSEFAFLVDKQLSTRCQAWGDPGKRIERVAVCGGSADDEWRNAKAEGANVLVTGEVRQHVALEASEAGFAIIAAGHYATEHPGSVALSKALQKELPAIEWLIYEPPPGLAGRPLTH